MKIAALSLFLLFTDVVCHLYNSTGCGAATLFYFIVLQIVDVDILNDNCTRMMFVCTRFLKYSMRLMGPDMAENLD